MYTFDAAVGIDHTFIDVLKKKSGNSRCCIVDVDTYRYLV